MVSPDMFYNLSGFYSCLLYYTYYNKAAFHRIIHRIKNRILQHTYHYTGYYHGRTYKLMYYILFLKH